MKLLKYSILLLVLPLALNFCSKQKSKPVTYKHLTIENTVCQLFCPDLFLVSFPVKYHNKIFFKSSSQIYEADLDKKEVKLLFKKGIGPDEVYLPYRLVLNDNELYISSFMSINHIFHFSLDSGYFNLQRMEIPTNIAIDDFLFLSQQQMVIAYVYWNEGDIVRIYDLKTKQYKSFGKRTFTPIMNKFNVNTASVCKLNDCLYAIQKIVPEIQVISISEQKVTEKIKLSPPFFRPMPAEYDVNGLDKKKHLEWLGRWTALYDILGKDNRLLVIYKTWVEGERRYYYELINLKDRSNRFYIDITHYRIYNFKIIEDRIFLEMFEEKENGVNWVETELKL